MCFVNLETWIHLNLPIKQLDEKFRKLTKEPVTWCLGNRLLLCALRAPQWTLAADALRGGYSEADVLATRRAGARISPRRSLARDRSKHPGRARESRRQVGSVGLRQCTGRRMPAQTSRPGYQGSTSHLRRNP